VELRRRRLRRGAAAPGRAAPGAGATAAGEPGTGRGSGHRLLSAAVPDTPRICREMENFRRSFTFIGEVEEESEAGKESEETETKQTLKEFRCQVSDCSRIFQAITGLIQHYMKLHEMTPEEIESMTASVDVGKFPCDQLECKSSFTTYLNYVVHLEADHGIGLRASKTEEDGVYKCDCEGCDRIYATRSNLLRHIFNKHNDKHKAHLIRPRRLTPGQENMSSKANQEKSKSKHRGTKHSRCGKEGIKMPKTKRKKK
ncbi:zinc finger protein 292, partial [Homo sapiens]